VSRRRIEAVLFDLGETLLVFGRLERKRLIDQAVRASYNYLVQLNQPVGSYAAYRLLHLWGIRWNLFKSWRSGADFNSLDLLKSYGHKRGFLLTEAQWEELSWRWYQVLARQGVVRDGTAETLDQLKRRGLKLGMLSNTFIHKSSLERHLREEGLLDYLPVRVYSYELPLRKPAISAFQRAAEAVGAAPENIVYVGDRLDNDVIGARNAGMTPVLIRAYTNEARRLPSDLHCVDAITKLPELLEKQFEVPGPPCTMNSKS
jgi:putative hydrolase of the HAD superfamily